MLLKDVAGEVTKVIGIKNNNNDFTPKDDKNYDAILFFQSAIEISENYTIPLYNEACSYALLGDIENTLLELEKLLNIQPKYLIKRQDDQDFDLFRQNRLDYTHLLQLICLPSNLNLLKKVHL